jgi:N-acetylglucosaminyl-diphospho-decaprenol L-rhamnosyltransferase
METTSADSPQPTTLVAIVNYRTGKLVVDCLRSLEPEMQGLPGSRVVVVDNNSPDDSANMIAEAIEANGWSTFATLQRSSVNGGFSFGNNVAVRSALQMTTPPNYYWLLNPDTRIYPDALRELMAFMQAHPLVGISGSSLVGEDGVPWPFAFRFPTIWSELDSGLRLGPVTALLKKHVVARRMGDHAEPVDWLPGASMLVRREVFEQIGMMDEGYFLYFEETDFCLQARRAGWETWYVPQSRVMHIAGQSTGVTGKQTERRRLPKYWFDSRRRYFTKNHGRLYAAATDLVWMLCFMAWRARRFIQKKPDSDPPHMLADFAANSALLHAGLPGNPALASPLAASRTK